jgi:CDP-diacylglycerol--serine O-phosphatidyltransferase
VIAMVIVPALLMVSTVRFRSFKQFDLQARRNYSVLLLVAIAIALIAAQPEYLLVVLAYGYLGFALFEFAWNRLRRRHGAHEEPHDDAAAKDKTDTDTKDTKVI